MISRATFTSSQEVSIPSVLNPLSIQKPYGVVYANNLIDLDRDLPFCGGSCYDTTAIQGAFPDLLAASKPNFPSAASFNTTIVPGGGHGLNMGYSHKATYDSMFNFLSSY